MYPKAEKQAGLSESKTITLPFLLPLRVSLINPAEPAITDPAAIIKPPVYIRGRQAGKDACCCADYDGLTDSSGSRKETSPPVCSDGAGCINPYVQQGHHQGKDH